MSMMVVSTKRSTQAKKAAPAKKGKRMEGDSLFLQQPCLEKANQKTKVELKQEILRSLD
jgi:hypothetical protein